MEYQRFYNSKNVEHNVRLDSYDNFKYQYLNFYSNLFNLETISPYLNGIHCKSFTKSKFFTKTLYTVEKSNHPKNVSHLENVQQMTNIEDAFIGGETNVEDNPTHKKKKRKRIPITVCTSNCRFDIVRRVTAGFGMKEVDEDDDWDICFHDGNVTIERSKEMKRFQRINHFPGMIEICRKDSLARNINRMAKCFPQDYNFFPKTWCLPSELTDALNYGKYHKNKTFIIKPECGSQGRGIFLTKNLKEIGTSEKLICQLYITRPYLINGYKFDIRVYSLISSCDPLSIFVYNEGLVRFATTRYSDPNNRNCANIFMHLTNYAINKQSKFYIYDQESGSKRKISTLNHLLEINGVNTKHIWNSVDEAIVKTIISAWPILNHNYHACFASHDTTQACFEILGFDILLDYRLQPHLLEVNHSPSFHTDTALDREVKESLLKDTLSLLNIWQCDKRKVMEEDRKRIKERLLRSFHRNSCDLTMEDKDILKGKSRIHQEQLQWENEHLGNYRRVYPNGDKYSIFFQQPSNTLYLSTMSSRARRECVKQQRSLIEAKEKSDILPSLINNSTMKNEAKRREFINQHKNNKSENTTKLPNIINKRELYECVPILECEEKKRVLQLDKRNDLIKNHGIVQIVYNIMKEVGTLSLLDEKKYGILQNKKLKQDQC